MVYETNGNTLTAARDRKFTWDFENRLVQAVVPGTNGGTATFKYDPFGRRIQKSGPLGTTNYLKDRVPLHRRGLTTLALATWPGGRSDQEMLSRFHSFDLQ